MGKIMLQQIQLFSKVLGKLSSGFRPVCLAIESSQLCSLTRQQNTQAGDLCFGIPSGNKFAVMLLLGNGKTLDILLARPLRRH
jgi:hypothetical protein